jgi:glycosyltransferase involved in cell wall biosynthesis
VRYLMVLKAPGYRLGPTTCAMESAFVDHLRAMKALLSPRFEELVVAAPYLSDAEYAANRLFSVIDEEKEGIRFEPLIQNRVSKLDFIRALPRLVPAIGRLVEEADLVHSHPDYDLWRPLMLIATAFAVAKRKKLIAVTDMDNRRDAAMNLRFGHWNRRAYLICKYIYDPIRDVQHRIYAKVCDLLMFKEPQQVADYGKGAPNVRMFFDPNFHKENIINADRLSAKVRSLEDPAGPLRVFYFGRMVPYKGVDRMIKAVAMARRRGANLTFDLMGSGSEEASLKVLIQHLGIGDVVNWLPTVPYGEGFFDVLRDHHLLLACPLSADTPRSFWDAMASGMPLLAFDTPFYRGLGNFTHAVNIVPWPDEAKLGVRLFEMAADKRRLVAMAQRAVEAAADNTGDMWLQRRVAWIDELFEKRAAQTRTRA